MWFEWVWQCGRRMQCWRSAHSAEVWADMKSVQGVVVCEELVVLVENHWPSINGRLQIRGFFTYEDEPRWQGLPIEQLWYESSTATSKIRAFTVVTTQQMEKRQIVSSDWGQGLLHRRVDLTRRLDWQPAPEQGPLGTQRNRIPNRVPTVVHNRGLHSHWDWGLLDLGLQGQ